MNSVKNGDEHYGNPWQHNVTHYFSFPTEGPHGVTVILEFN